MVSIGREDKSKRSLGSWYLWFQVWPLKPIISMERATKNVPVVEGGLHRDPRVPCPLHGHPSSPTILSLLCAVCFHLHLFTPHCLHQYCPCCPNPAHTLFSRLCLSACTCHGSLQGTVQTACSALSPAPCFPCDQEHLHVCRSCDFKNVCLMCRAWLLPAAHFPVLA